MKVLILTTHINKGGISRYVLNLAGGLKQQGHQVLVASSGGFWERSFREKGIGLIKIPLNTKFILSWKVFLSCWILLRSLKENPVDVIHCNARVSQFLGFLLWKMTGIPYVCAFHGRYRPHFFRRVIKVCGVLSIAISQGVKRLMVTDLKLPESSIRVVYNGIDPEDYRNVPDKVYAREKCGIKGDPVVGIIARLSAEKNHITLLKAFKSVFKIHPKAELVFLGEGKKEKELRAFVNKEDLEGKVLFLKENPIAEVLACLDVFVLPSLEEGFGLSAAEAMLAGIPTIVADVEGLNEIIERDATGLLFGGPTNDKALSEAILRLLGDEKLYRKIASGGQRAVRERFLVSHMVSGTAAVYEEAVRARFPSRETVLS